MQTTITVRIGADLKAQLKKRADAERRSVSQVVVLALEKALKRPVTPGA